MKFGSLAFILILFLNSKAIAQNIELVHDAFVGDCGGYPCGISPHSLCSINNVLYYTGYSHDTPGDPRLWSYNGTGTPVLVPSSPNNYINEIKSLDTIILLSGRNNGETELWKYNALDPPQQMTVFNQISNNVALTDVRDFIALRDDVYFRVNVTDSSDIWRYNVITQQIENVCPDSVLNSPSRMIVFNDTLFFTPALNTTSVHSYSGSGSSSPRSDFQPPGSISSGLFGVFDTTLIYSIKNSNLNNELWRYTLNGAHEFIYEFLPTGNANPTLQVTYAEFQGKLYFIGDLGDGKELLVYDGQNPPTMVADIFPGVGSSEIQEMIVFRNKLCFTANDNIHGPELYMYDGVNPPEIYEDFYPGEIGSSPSNFHIYDGDLYFSAENPIYGNELHRIREEASVDENMLSRVVIFPNPSQGKVVISSDLSIDEVVITDIVGRQVMRAKYYPELEIEPLSGVYIIQMISNGKEIDSKRIIIE